MDILSAEEMAGWLRPRDALLAVPVHVEESARKAWLIFRLQSGLISARQGNGSMIPAEHWTWREVGTDVWASGDMRITDATPTDPDTFAAPDFFDGERWSSEKLPNPVERVVTTIIYFDVLFDPASFRSSDPEGRHSGPARVARRQDLPVLPAGIAEAWASWFLSQPNATKESAEASALHMFPNHNLSRERVRELMKRSRDEKSAKPKE